MIYFDNAATTTVDKEILSSFNLAVEQLMGNSSSSHREGMKASLMEQKARRQAASFFGASEEEVVFTSGATESNNLALRGCAFRYRSRGKHIITTKIEHLSVLETCRQLQELFGFEVTYLDVDPSGVILLEDLKRSIREDTILVSVMAVNNEVGSIQPIAEIGELLQQYPKVHFHVDATQAIGKVVVDYRNVDLISLSGHKINSFKAAGLLIKRKKTELLPILTGGGHQHGLRSGTTNVPGEIALAKALRLAFGQQSGRYAHVSDLKARLVKGLRQIPGIELNSPAEASPFIVSFSVPKKGSVVAEALSNRDIYVSTKSACSSKKESVSYVLGAMGKSRWAQANSLRVSFSYENTAEEVDEFLRSLREILEEIK